MVLECRLKNNDSIMVEISRINIEDTIESILLTELDIKKGMMIISEDIAKDLGYSQIGFKNPPVEIRFTDKKVEIVALNYKGMHLMEYLFNQITNKFDCFEIDRKKHKLSLIFNNERNYDIKQKNKILNEVLIYTNELLILEECPFFSVYGILENQVPICRGKLESKFEASEYINSMIIYIPDEIYISNYETNEVTQIKYELKLTEICNIEVPMYVEDFSLPEVMYKQELICKIPYKSSNIFTNIRLKENMAECFIINTGKGVITGNADYTYLNTFSLKKI